MKWSSLLTSERFKAKEGSAPPSQHPQSEVSVFSEDAGRIIYSSYFRRLQGKTQVHPLPFSDYLRTRLTHTNEVAHAGRAIANACARKLTDEKRFPGDDFSHFGDITYAACLAHDIGNPPFGHIGEYAIQTWFKRRKETSNLPSVKNLFEKHGEASDLLDFDGNAQGFRILTRLSGWRDSGGLQLGYATIGAFTKYPHSSKHSGTKKKFGYMREDSAFAQNIFDKLGMIGNDGKWNRHPLAYITEAADDICYLTTDIEDAFKAKLIPYNTAKDLLWVIGDTANHISRFSHLNGSSEEDKIAYLRAGAVSALIDCATDTFIENIDRILGGTYNQNMLEDSKYRDFISAIRATCETTIYVNMDKMQVESAGYNVIMTLMDLFGGMIEQYVETKDLDKRNKGIREILPKDFSNRLGKDDLYRSYLILVDYISGMTDRFALELYQKLTGSSVALGRMI